MDRNDFKGVRLFRNHWTLSELPVHLRQTTIPRDLRSSGSVLPHALFASK